MSVQNYNDLEMHYGHEINVAIYGDDVNVALECNDCDEVLLSFDK